MILRASGASLCSIHASPSLYTCTILSESQAEERREGEVEGPRVYAALQCRRREFQPLLWSVDRRRPRLRTKFRQDFVAQALLPVRSCRDKLQDNDFSRPQRRVVPLSS